MDMEPLVRAYNRVRQRINRDEMAGVAEPGRLRRLGFVDFLTWLACLVVYWLAVFHTPDHCYLAATLTAVPTFTLGAWLFLRKRRRRARVYSRGWLDGRKAMIASIEESMRRGIPPEQWVWLEVERDQQVIDHL